MINIQPISNVLGVLLLVFGAMMFVCIPFGSLDGYREYAAFLWSGSITMAVGFVFWIYKFSSSATINKREGYLIVALGWLAMALFGMFPYLFSSLHVPIENSLFEAVSGLTTTGATIFTDIESLPKMILMWRSVTQWIGGMGIIVLTIAIFPLLGIGGIDRHIKLIV